MIQPFPVAANELQRVETLHKLGVLQAVDHPCLERVVRTAVAVFDVPIVMINLITDTHEINTVCYGVPPGHKQDRQISFCNYTILSDEPLIIENALEHENFKDSPQVLGRSNVRFYAGMPLTARDGTHPGSLCLTDTKPRHFSRPEIQLLRDLAHWAELEINNCISD